MEKNKELSHELFLISHTHWDREWYLPFQRFRMHLVNFMDHLIKILGEDPHYRHFNLDGQTILIEDYLDIRPEMKDTLVELIKTNRIAIGPWYNQPDEWYSGELLVRNLLKGNTLAKQYGLKQNIGYCPDLFGHVSQMPQILNLAGLDTFMFFRGLGQEYDDPYFTNEFFWEGPDGSKLLTYYMPGGYANAKNHPDDPIQFNNFMLFAFGRISKSKSHIYYIGCGGDHYLPQKTTPELISQFNCEEDIIEELEGGKIHHASLTEFFDAIKQRINVEDPPITIKGELRYGRADVFEPGNISSRIHLKQLNAKCWRKLCYQAEPLVALLSKISGNGTTNTTYLQMAWKYLLQNQPHDSICGCSIDPVHRDMEYRFAQCDHIADELILEQLRILMLKQQKLSETLKNPNTIPIIIFNPHPYELDIVMKTWIARDRNFYESDIIFMPNANFDCQYHVIDPNGEELPCVIQKARYKGSQLMLKVSWLAKKVPGMGYFVYNLIPEPQNIIQEPQKLSLTYENKWAKLTFNSDGSFNLDDKRLGLTYPNLHNFEDQADAGDGYDFYALPNDIPKLSKGSIANVSGKKTLFGAIFKVYYYIDLPTALNQERTERLGSTQKLKIYSKIRISDEIPRIDCTTKITNNIKDHRMRIVFPTQLNNNHVAAASIYDVVERGIGIESFGDTKNWSQQPVPTSHMNQFVDLHEKGKGSFSIFSKGLPEYEARRDENGVSLILTLFRAFRYEGGNMPGRGVAGSPIPVPEAELQKSLRFDYALYFHENNWEEDHLLSHANEYIIPISRTGGLVTIPGRRLDQSDVFDEYEKNLSNQFTFLKLSNSNLILTTIKLAEKEKVSNSGNTSLVLRLYNPLSKSQSSLIDLGLVIKKVFALNILEEKMERSDCSLKLINKFQFEIILPAKKIFTIGIEI